MMTAREWDERESLSKSSSPNCSNNSSNLTSERIENQLEFYLGQYVLNIPSIFIGNLYWNSWIIIFIADLHPMDCKCIVNIRQTLLYGHFGIFSVLLSTYNKIQLYLFLLVAFKSETLYIEVHNRMAAAFSLFVSAMIYAAIFAYLYWARYINIDRKLDLKR